MFKKSLFIGIAALTFTASLGSAQTTIERLAPENTVLIVGSKSVQSIMDHAKATGLWSLWQSDQLKAMRADAIKQMGEGITKMFQDLGVEEDSLVPPSGPIGVAIFPLMDKDTRTTKVAFVALADYGDPANADKTSTLLQAALTKGEKEGKLEFEEKDVNGRKVVSVDLSKLEAAKDEDQDGDDRGGMDGMGGMGGMPPGMPNPKDLMKGIQKLSYVRDGNAFVLSSDLETLSESLDTIDGKGPANGGVSQRNEFQSIMTKLGEGDAYAIVLTRDIMDIVGGGNPMMGMMVPMIRSIFGKVDGYGASLRMDSSTAMVEMRYSVYMPEGKKGVTALLDHPTPRASAPAFISQDAISFTSVNFDFGGIMDIIGQLTAMAPPEVRQQVAQFDPKVRAITATLGQKVYMATNVTKPYRIENHASVWAVECTKPREFENALNDIIAATGVQGRDFLGQRIYTFGGRGGGNQFVPGLPMGPGGEVSIGIGGGFVFVGPDNGVEQSLRVSGQPGGGSLALNSDFQRAIGSLPQTEVVAWGFRDTIDSIEASVEAERAVKQAQIDEAKQDDPEYAQEMQKEFDKSSAMLKKLDFNLLREYIGPSAWLVRSAADGFEGSYFLFSANNAKKQMSGQ